MRDPKSPYSQIGAPFPEQDHLNCPRCNSGNTKFCYYNNYNLSQPRHFCKACRRYWTKGGTLRNIPVGGGSRKIAKRTSSPSPASSAKRPASSAPPSGEVTDKMPSKEDGGFEEFAGASVGLSFSSLLGCAEDDFGNLLDGASGLQMDHGLGDRPDNDLGSGDSNISNDDGFLGGGSNGWPDLSMYTPPGSSFL